MGLVRSKRRVTQGIQCQRCKSDLPATICRGEACAKCGAIERDYLVKLEESDNRIVKILRRALRSALTWVPLRISDTRTVGFAFQSMDPTLIPQYKPVGKCIYCGSTNELSREHIIPYGLNGDLVLAKASCKDCATITSSFEGEILQGELKSLRTKLQFRSRRRTGPKTVLFTLTTDAGSKELQIPIENSPIIWPSPVLSLAGFFEGVPTRGTRIIGSRGINWGRDPYDVVRSLGGKGFSMNFTIKPPQFGKMLAKIGYSYAVAELGLSTIRKVFVLPALLGLEDDVGMWVGSGPDRLKIPPAALHYLQLDVRDLDDDEVLVLVHIKLFANSPTATYTVVVGTASRPAAREHRGI